MSIATGAADLERPKRPREAASTRAIDDAPAIVPAILIGPGIVPGRYGGTDRYLMSSPIRWETGLPSARGGEARPTLDDLGATLLAWFGVEDRARLGYWGRPFGFLLA